MSMQSLKKIGQKVLKLDYGNEALTDGWTDGVVSDWNYPTCNSIPLLADTNVYAKFEENKSKGT